MDGKRGCNERHNDLFLNYIHVSFTHVIITLQYYTSQKYTFPPSRPALLHFRVVRVATHLWPFAGEPHPPALRQFWQPWLGESTLFAAVVRGDELRGHAGAVAQADALRTEAHRRQQDHRRLRLRLRGQSYASSRTRIIFSPHRAGIKCVSYFSSVTII